MNKIVKKTLLSLSLISTLGIFLCFTVIGPTPKTAEALGDANPYVNYIPLAPLPGTYQPGTSRTDLNTYIQGLFKLIIGIAAVLAFFMIVWGGFTYITSDSIGGKEDGKEYIEHALGGLLLALVAFLFLQTVNPKLVSFNLNFEPARAPAQISLRDIEVNRSLFQTTNELIQLDEQIANSTGDIRENLIQMSNAIRLGRGATVKAATAIEANDMFRRIEAQNEMNAAYRQAIDEIDSSGADDPESVAMASRLANEQIVQNSFIDKMKEIKDINRSYENLNYKINTLDSLRNSLPEYTNQQATRVEGDQKTTALVTQNSAVLRSKIDASIQTLCNQSGNTNPVCRK